MIKLYIINAMGLEPYENLIAECENIKECRKAIKTYLNKINFKSYYQRIWGEDNNIIIDYGSHTKYFKITGITVEEWINNDTQ